jgi:hypothetical protein
MKAFNKFNFAGVCAYLIMAMANATVVVEKLDPTKKIATIKVVGKIAYEEDQILSRS